MVTIALDSNDKVRISYYDKYHDRLRYGTNASGSWSKQSIDFNLGLNVDFQFEDEPGTDIYIDSNNKVHISYIKLSNCVHQWNGLWRCDVSIRYITNKNGFWDAETVYSYTGDGQYLYPPSIAVDSYNKVHIAFTFCDFTYDWLYYASNDHNVKNVDGCELIEESANWVVCKLPVGSWRPPYEWNYPGLFPSIAIDSDNKVHIIHSEWHWGNLLYTTNAGGAWDTYVADVTGYYAETTALTHDSIAIDPAGRIRTSYHDFINKDLKYGYCPDKDKPNLRVETCQYCLQNQIPRGSRLQLTDVTKNFIPPCGRNRPSPWAVASVTTYKLSSDSTITHSDRSIGSRMIPALSVGAQSKGTTTVTIPTDITPGVIYYLGVCADDTSRNQELNKNDNCVFIDYFQAT
jgi:hypothetical protein